MAIEFNIDGSADKMFFLGEDKYIDLEIFGQDGKTPIDVSAYTLEWTLRKKDNSPDPALLKRVTDDGISIIGTFDADPTKNTQRVRIAFPSDHTDPVETKALEEATTQQPTIKYELKPSVTYRHSLKRKDAGYEGILTYGSFVFLQATER